MLSLAPTPYRRLFLSSSLFVASLDLITKYAATHLLPDHTLISAKPLDYFLIYHAWHVDALGVPYTYPLISNLLFPALAILNVILFSFHFNYWFQKYPDPIYSDTIALAFGCSVAGCIGNSVSYLFWSKGVPDFWVLPFSRFSFNFADVALIMGTLLALGGAISSWVSLLRPSPALPPTAEISTISAPESAE